MDTRPAPRISIVTAMYNTAPFLTQMLESIAAQTIGRDAIELIIVDDGSTDGSVELARQEIARLGITGQVLEQEHQFQAVARNKGIELARGEWVNFLDSDDWINPIFFERMLLLAEESAKAGFSVDVLVAHAIFHYQETGRTLDLYPLAWRFNQGDILVDLDKDPNHINLQCGPLMVRRELFERTGLRFDPKVYPCYEDSSLFNLLLLECDRPLVGYCDSAEYYYRKRAQSSVAGAWAHIGRYAEILAHGQMPLIERSLATRGDVAAWITANLLYDEGWVLYANDELNSRTDWLTDQQRAAYCELLATLFKRCRPEDVWSPYFAHVTADMRAAILATSQGFYDITDSYVRTPDPKLTGLDRLTYRFGLDRSLFPHEKVYVDGCRLGSFESGTRRHAYFDGVGFYERTLYVPRGAKIDLVLDGIHAREVKTLAPDVPTKAPAAHPLLTLPAPTRTARQTIHTGAMRMKKSLGNAYRASRKHPATRWAASEVKEYLTRTNNKFVPAPMEKLARTKFAEWPATQTGFRANVLAEYSKPQAPRGAWVLYDSYERADDNAEHLTRYLLANRPDLDVVYLLNRDSQDWDRLAAEGFPLLPSGTTAAIDAIRHAAVLLSSHADLNKEKPVARAKKPGGWSTPFVFLQHGVTKDDLSQWLNAKDIDLIVAATREEYGVFTTSMASPYTATSLSTALTGFPRWDRLTQLARQSERDRGTRCITLMPTWRRNVVLALQAISDEGARAQAFRDSDYMAPWVKLLQDEELQAAAHSRGLCMQMVVHPSFSRIVDVRRAFPNGQVKSYNDIKIQEVLSGSEYVITDNSSIAFDAAYIGCRIAYLHEGFEDIYSGSHMYRRGYFDYTRDGFGPVAASAEDLSRILVADIRQSSIDGFVLPSDGIFASRAERAFGNRDDQNCRRVTAAVEELLRQRDGKLPDCYSADTRTL